MSHHGNDDPIMTPSDSPADRNKKKRASHFAGWAIIGVGAVAFGLYLMVAILGPLLGL